MKRVLCMMILAALLLSAAALGESEVKTSRWMLGKSILELPDDWHIGMSEDGKSLNGDGIQIMNVSIMAGGLSNMLDGMMPALRNQMILSSDETRFGSTDSFTADNGAFGTLFVYQEVPCAHIVNGNASVLVAVQGSLRAPQEVFDAVALGLSVNEALDDAEKTHVVGDFAVREPAGWMKAPARPGLDTGLSFIHGSALVSFTVHDLDFTADPGVIRDQMLSQAGIMQSMDTAAGIPCTCYFDDASSCYTVMLFSDDSVGVIVVTGEDRSAWEAAGKELAENVTYR